MDWEKYAIALKKGISISKKVATKSKKVATEVLNDYQKQQAYAQRRLNDARSRAERLSDEELERKVMKAYKEEGKRDLETAMMAHEYIERKKRE